MNIADLTIYGRKYSAGAVELLPQTQAILDYAIANSYDIPYEGMITAMDALIGNMIAIGIWDKFDVFYNFAYNGLSIVDFAGINWKNPGTAQITHPAGSVYLHPGGFQGEGTSKYLDTNFIPSVDGLNYSLNDASRGMVVYLPATLGSFYDGGSSLNNCLVRTSSPANRINSANSLNVAIDLGGTGLKVICRANSSNLEITNGAGLNARTQTSSSLPTTSQWILKASAGVSNATISCYFMGGFISGSVLQDFRTYYNVYLSTLGLATQA